MVQTVGLSGLKPNCICLNFPTVKSDRTDYSFFYNVARHANVTDCALIVTKNIDNFPDTNEIATVYKIIISNTGRANNFGARQDGR